MTCRVGKCISLAVLIAAWMGSLEAFFQTARVRVRGVHYPVADRSLKAEEDASRQQFPLGRFAFSLLPLSPESVGRRKTILTEVVKGQIWTLDQIQGVINVNTPVRAVVVKLQDGGLLVHNPVAPTLECLDMVRELEATHGLVSVIVLPTLGIEHKGTCSVFASYFRGAEVFVQPGQYAFPLNLPTPFFFPLGQSVKEIPVDASEAPWYATLDHKSLGPLKPRGVGGFAETAFFHRDSGTLLVTDAIVRVDNEPPAIIADDPRALLYHARDDMFQIVGDTAENRRKGWRRMVLFGLTFQPAGIKILELGAALKMIKNVPAEMARLGEGAIPFFPGLYPWEWVADDRPSFRALQGGLLVAPILQKLILNREPERVLAWADDVARWPIRRIIPAHLANDIKADSSAFRRAFNFLEENEGSPGLLTFLGLGGKKKASPAPTGASGDVKLLEDVSRDLTQSGVLFPEAPLVKR